MTQAVNNTAAKAVMMHTDMDLWHHRIISGVGENPIINLGFITSTKTAEVPVYNSYLIEQTLVKIDLVDLDGISIASAMGVPPIKLPPLRTKKILLDVSPYGSTKIDGRAILRFENGQSITIRIKGVRGLIWNIEPNWDEPLREKFSFKTNVITSYNKTEQRRGFMTQPRRALSYTATPHGALLAAMRNVMYATHGRPISCPIWWQSVRLREPCLKGSNRLKCHDLRDVDTIQKDSILVLWNNPFDYELTLVARIEDNDVILQDPLTRTFTVTAICYPTVNTRLDPTAELTNNSSSLSLMEVSADFVNPSESIGALKDAEAGLEKLNGVEVLTKRPNWADDIVEHHQSDITVIDYGYGQKEWFGRGVPSMVSRELTFVSKSREETAWWRRFIQRRKGQLKSFYVSTETKDLTIAADILSTINNQIPVPKAIVVEDHQITTMLRNFGNRKFLRIRASGKSYFFTIERIEKYGEFARIHVLEDIAVSIPKDSVTSASFVQRMRLASDDVEIEHVSSTVAKIKLNLQQVKEI